METVYHVVWKLRYKKLEISTNHIMRTVLHGNQEIQNLWDAVEWKPHYESTTL